MPSRDVIFRSPVETIKGLRSFLRREIFLLVSININSNKSSNNNNNKRFFGSIFIFHSWLPKVAVASVIAVVVAAKIFSELIFLELSWLKSQRVIRERRESSKRKWELHRVSESKRKQREVETVTKRKRNGEKSKRKSDWGREFEIENHLSWWKGERGRESEWERGRKDVRYKKIRNTERERDRERERESWIWDRTGPDNKWEWGRQLESAWEWKWELVQESEKVQFSMKELKKCKLVQVGTSECKRLRESAIECKWVLETANDC